MSGAVNVERELVKIVDVLSAKILGVVDEVL